MELKRKRFQIRKYKTSSYIIEAMRQLQPPEDLTVAEWADKYRMLDAKTSAMPGPWRNDKTPYLIDIMNELQNYDTEEIIFCQVYSGRWNRGSAEYARLYHPARSVTDHGRISDGHAGRIH